MPVTRIELESFSSSLKREERTPGTIGKYLRGSGEFASWLGERELAKDTAAGWREHLLEAGYAPPPSTPCCPPSTRCSGFWEGRIVKSNSSGFSARHLR